MASLARPPDAPRSESMGNVAHIDPDTAWAAFMRRDRAMGRAGDRRRQDDRHLLQAELPGAAAEARACRVLRDGEEARAAGFAPCLRCKPDEVGRDRRPSRRRCRLIEQAEEPPTLDELARAVGYAPHHFQRLFKRDSACRRRNMPAALRNQRTEAALEANGRVTDAIYDAGYSGPSSFYSDAKERLGMTPSAWRDGGRGETIRWTPFRQPARARC